MSTAPAVHVSLPSTVSVRRASVPLCAAGRESVCCR